MSDSELLYRLDSLKYRPYPRYVVALAAISFFLVFWDVYNIGFVLPIAADQLGVAINSFLYALPITTGLIGYVAGELVLGRVSDLYGRRIGLMITLILTALGSLLAALSLNFIELSIFRFIIGLGIGAEIAIIPTYMSEITPPHLRGTFVGWTTAVGMIEILPVGAMAFFIVPLISWGWRLMLGIGSLVAIPALLLRFLYLPESPRWLILKGKVKEAEKVISKMEDFVKNKYGSLERISTSKGEAFIRTSGFRVILKRPYLERWLLMFVVWFSYYLGDYALVSVVPTLFIVHGFTVTKSYLYFFLSSSGDSVGSFSGMYLSDKLERKYLGLIIMILSAIFFPLWGLGIGGDPGIILFGFLVFFTQGFWLPVIYGYTAEIFPTEVRATGMFFTDGLGHIGGAISPYVILPIAFSAGFLGLGGYVSAFTAMGLSALVAGILVGLLGPKTLKKRLALLRT
ncbi:MFS transporter [Sulfolobus sp. S-194]|uniref:MFS transporter n=1 Tax=Sulfolobus sp. S-194 TaxID=2512240 RepID=UPI00143723E2|nr:MFS transporter [Sulfolobus sp. S-194]QIW23835.1 MFS transporter [Sulfolobus sp. S-194]